MDDHLEMAYEDANGSLVAEGEAGPPEELLSAECLECGAAPGVQCDPDCPDYIEDLD